MKLGMRDYVRETPRPTPHDNFGGGSETWVVSANMSHCHISEFFSYLTTREAA